MYMRWPLVVLLVLHGLIHLIGSPPALPGCSRACCSSAAALGLARRRGWWRAAALAGVVVSQALIVLWWRDAQVGTLPNVAILVAVLWPRMPTRQSRGLAVGAHS